MRSDDLSRGATKKGLPMAQNFEIAVFEGDGIGPEIMAPTLDLLTVLAGESSAYDLSF